MTPELRAARDSLGAALAAWDEHAHPAEIDIITSVYGKEPGVYFPIRASSLRAVLAELDRHDSVADPSTWREPCNVALSHTGGQIRCQLPVSDPLPEGYLESGGRYTGNRNHWEKHWHEDGYGNIKYWTDDESGQP